MKKGFITFLILFGFFSVNAQKKKTEKVKDTIKSEVIDVITTYNPKIADAKKIRKNPVVKLLQRSKKKKLKYTIFSVPVASTFIPKSGVVKKIDVGAKERIYDNYIATGFGNYTTPYFETFLTYNTRDRNVFGLSAKYLASLENIKNSVLNSTFSNLNTELFYKQQDQYSNWKVSLNLQRNQYNWYGLPNLNFNPTTINSIAEQQTYNYFKLLGKINFIDTFVDNSKLSLSYFSDAYKTAEILANADAKLTFPLDFLNSNLSNINIKTGIEFLKGKFKNSYQKQNAVNYTTFTANINPEYKMSYDDFSFKIGAKLYASLDLENNSNNFFVLPDISVEKSIIKNNLNVYAGFVGDLHTNTYKKFTEKNPYISPTLFITQTLEKSNLFLGFNGKMTNTISFDIKASLKNEEDKPLFLRNNSKSNGTTTTAKNISLKGYEYGNSFSVYYDDIKTTSLFAEVTYDFSKEISFGSQLELNLYTTTKASEKWNLPALQASLFGKYKSDKWYATTNIFYVSEKKDALYDAPFPSILSGVQTIDSFIDVNLSGGYHFSDKFSVFLKLKNILNTKCQRFANFDTQGFQILGGLSYRFDF